MANVFEVEGLKRVSKKQFTELFLEGEAGCLFYERSPEKITEIINSLQNQINSSGLFKDVKFSLMNCDESKFKVSCCLEERKLNAKLTSSIGQDSVALEGSANLPLLGKNLILSSLSFKFDSSKSSSLSAKVTNILSIKKRWNNEIKISDDMHSKVFFQRQYCLNTNIYEKIKNNSYLHTAGIAYNLYKPFYESKQTSGRLCLFVGTNKTPTNTDSSSDFIPRGFSFSSNELLELKHCLEKNKTTCLATLKGTLNLAKEFRQITSAAKINFGVRLKLNDSLDYFEKFYIGGKSHPRGFRDDSIFSTAESNIEAFSQLNLSLFTNIPIAIRRLVPVLNDKNSKFQFFCDSGTICSDKKSAIFSISIGTGLIVKFPNNIAVEYNFQLPLYHSNEPMIRDKLFRFSFGTEL